LNHLEGFGTDFLEDNHPILFEFFVALQDNLREGPLKLYNLC